MLIQGGAETFKRIGIGKGFLRPNLLMMNLHLLASSITVEYLAQERQRYNNIAQICSDEK